MPSFIAQLLKSLGPPPARLADFVASLPALSPLLEQMAHAIQCNDDPRFASSLATACHALSQSALLPLAFHPQAGPADCVALLQDCLCHAVMVHPACTDERKAAVRVQVARSPAAADALAPLVVQLLATPPPATDEAMGKALLRDRPIFQAVAKVLLVQDEAAFKKQFAQLVHACSAPGSPYAIASHVESLHSMMRVQAKLALCNTIMSAPGCSQKRRDALINALIMGSDTRLPDRPAPAILPHGPGSSRTGFASRFR